MKNKLKLYNVTDGYIDYLQAVHKHVYSNKEDTRVNMRKYIGVVFRINNYKYFIPLSSPKEDDYIKEDNGDLRIRTDSFLIWRIISGTGINSELRGTIRIANMIPVPTSELIEYNINEETDKKYKDLVEEEQEYIRKIADPLIKRAKIVYKNKTHNNPAYIYNYCLERMHNDWLQLVSNSFE